MLEDSFSSWKKKIILFLTSQTITLFGSSLVQFAIIWYIAMETDSGLMLSLSTLCAFLPQVLVALFGGVLADRHSRKTMIVLADGMIAASTLVLAWYMMNGMTEIWMILLVSAIRSLGAGVQMPAVSALIPQIVPKEHLMRISGINGSIQSLVNLASPAVGGAVLTYGAFYNILFIDVVTAVIGISILLTISIPLHEKAKEMKETKEKLDVLSDLKEGIAYAKSSSFIRKLFVFFIAFSFLAVVPALLNVLMVTRVFGDSYWNLTLNEMAFFVGMMMGGGLLAVWGGFKNRIMTLCVGSLLFGILTFIVGFMTVFWIYLILMVLTGIAIPSINSPVMVLLQEKVDPNYQGRVFSLIQIVGSIVMPAGMMVFGPIADIISVQLLMSLSGVALIIASIVLFNYKSFIKEGEPLLGPPVGA